MLRLFSIFMLFSIHITAQAETISYTDTFSSERRFDYPTNLDDKLDILDNAGTFSVSRFDPGLGDLTAATVTYSSMNMRVSASATFRDPDFLGHTAGVQEFRVLNLMAEFDGRSYLPSYYRDIHKHKRFELMDSCGQEIDLPESKCSTSIPPKDYEFADESTRLVNSYPSYPGHLGPLTAFVGTGELEGIFQHKATVWTDENHGDDGYIDERDIRIQATGRITIDYEYTPVADVPIPAAAWLFGSALLGLGVVKRKKA